VAIVAEGGIFYPCFRQSPVPEGDVSLKKHVELCNMITGGGGHQPLNVSPTGGALGQIPLLGNTNTNIYT
jgi:hypothetical protein